MTDANLVAQLHALARAEHDDLSIGEDAAERIEALIAERNRQEQTAVYWRKLALSLHDEINAVKHDIERHIKIASDLATENKTLRALLKEVLAMHETK